MSYVASLRCHFEYLWIRSGNRRRSHPPRFGMLFCLLFLLCMRLIHAHCPEWEAIFSVCLSVSQIVVTAGRLLGKDPYKCLCCYSALMTEQVIWVCFLVRKSWCALINGSLQKWKTVSEEPVEPKMHSMKFQSNVSYQMRIFCLI